MGTTRGARAEPPPAEASDWSAVDLRRGAIRIHDRQYCALPADSPVAFLWKWGHPVPSARSARQVQKGWDMNRTHSSSRREARTTRLLRDTRGATMVEYAVLLFMILVVAAAVYRQVGKNVRMSGDKTTAAFQ